MVLTALQHGIMSNYMLLSFVLEANIEVKENNIFKKKKKKKEASDLLRSLIPKYDVKMLSKPSLHIYWVFVKHGINWSHGHHVVLKHSQHVIYKKTEQ